MKDNKVDNNISAEIKEVPKKISYSYKQIEDLANDFLENINPNNEFPINNNIWENAKEKYKTQILYGNLVKDPDLIGSIVYDTRPQEMNIVQQRFNKDAVILINTNFSKNRQLFTIAHEFGHYLLLNKTIPQFGTEDRTTDINYDEKSTEYAANLFAGCVLMPMNKIVEYLDVQQLLSDNYSLSKETIKLLKDKFGVSENVIKARIDVVRKFYCLA